MPNRKNRRSPLWSNLSHPWFRRLVKLPPLPADFTIEIARTTTDLEAAYRLLHDVYVEIGFMEPHPSGMRLHVYNMLPHTTTAVAKVKGEVVGTISITRENPLGLPLDETVNTQIFRRLGVQVAEVTGLAVRKDWRGEGRILFPLLKYIYNYGVQFQHINCLQIATALSKEDFFRGLLFFEPINEASFRDPFINGRLARALYLDLQHAKTKFRQAYESRPTHGNLFAYFTSLDLPGFHYPNRNPSRAMDPVWTPEMFFQFFRRLTNLAERLSDREIHALREIYQDSEILDLLPEAQSLPPFPPRRNSGRVSVSCRAVLEGEHGDESVTLLDVSETGFRLLSKLPMRFSGECHFRIVLNRHQTIPLVARPVWNNRRREWGFELVRRPLGWKEFLRSLHLSASEAA